MKLPTLFSLPEATTLTTLLTTLSPTNPSPGCGAPLPANLTLGGPSINLSLSSPLSSPNTTLQTRNYNLHLPQTYSSDQPQPLLLVLHGQYQPPVSIENYTLFSTPAFNPNSVVVYPEGVATQWLGDPAAPPSTEVNDIQFLSDLLDSLESNFCIDTNRIYAAGFSNGGGLTGLLACNETVGSRFAALAGVAAAYYKDESLTEPLFGEGCTGGGKIPYLEIHGTSDEIIAYDGDNTPSPNTFPVSEFIDKMTTLSGCDPSESGLGGLTGLETNSTQLLNGGNVTKSSWTCDGREDVVVHYKVEGLGHGWPSTVYYGGILDEYRRGPTTWNASAVIGEWFSRWTRGSADLASGDVEELLREVEKL